MNYFRHYVKLIRRAKNRTPSKEHEKHHIIPKCLGKLRKKPKAIWDAKYNIAALTPKEHFIAHLLLTKIFSNPIYKQKMIFSLLMFYQNNAFQQRKITAAQYEHLRKVHRESLLGENNPFFGRNHSEETKQKQREAKFGKSSPKSSLTGYEQFSYTIYYVDGRIEKTGNLRKYGRDNGLKLNLHRFSKPNPPKSKLIKYIACKVP